ncbi:MAG: polyphosphate polymerase domain-containing protein [Spirochaetales bacterium]|nr:polyphosphate polymerase domain-containing protein [Spirochaetales bacterium]
MLKTVINNRIERMEPVSLKDLSRVSLLSRTDTKYVGSLDQLVLLLQSVSDDYYVLSHQGIRNFSYETTYMDTPDFKLYTAHQNGRTNRYKIRTREYRDSGLVFDEIKFKNNKGTTVKKRINREAKDAPLDKEFLDFINLDKSLEAFSDQLVPMLDVSYRRITFVNKDFTERITLDFNLRFNHESKNDILGNLFIMEIKRNHGSEKSIMENALRTHKIMQTGISKYCVGIASTREDVKINRFKPLIRKLEKINYISRVEEVQPCPTFMEYSA